MTDSSSSHERPRKENDEILELDNELEKMIEAAEYTSVQLTWMAYDVVALQTSPELGALMQRLMQAYQHCRGAVCGDHDPQPVMKD